MKIVEKFLKPPALTNAVSIAVLLMRLGFGALLIPIGFDKLQVFITGDHNFPDPLHISPIVSQALTIFAEFFCSIFIVLGLFSRPAAAILVFCMAIIAFVIHKADPLSDKQMALLYLLGFLTILQTGPGKYSLDSRIFK